MNIRQMSAIAHPGARFFAKSAQLSLPDFDDFFDPVWSI
jgi:hypothetical protein